jgi:hypothetical protein
MNRKNWEGLKEHMEMHALNQGAHLVQFDNGTINTRVSFKSHQDKPQVLSAAFAKRKQSKSNGVSNHDALNISKLDY